MNTSSDKKILVCTNFRANPNSPSCGARGGNNLLAALTSRNLAIPTEESACMGLCHVGPNVRLVPNGASFHEVSLKKLHTLLEEIKTFTTC